MMRLMVSAPITSTFRCVPGGDETRAGHKPVDESAACRHEVEAPGFRRSEVMLHQAGGGREQHVRSNGAYQDRVEFAGVDAPLSQRGAKSWQISPALGNRDSTQ